MFLAITTWFYFSFTHPILLRHIGSSQLFFFLGSSIIFKNLSKHTQLFSLQWLFTFLSLAFSTLPWGLKFMKCCRIDLHETKQSLLCKIITERDDVDSCDFAFVGPQMSLWTNPSDLCCSKLRFFKAIHLLLSKNTCFISDTRLSKLKHISIIISLQLNDIEHSIRRKHFKWDSLTISLIGQNKSKLDKEAHEQIIEL